MSTALPWACKHQVELCWCCSTASGSNHLWQNLHCTFPSSFLSSSFLSSSFLSPSSFLSSSSSDLASGELSVLWVLDMLLLALSLGALRALLL